MTLNQIALEMKNFALNHPRPGLVPINLYQHSLPNGLVLTHHFNPGSSTWTLSLVRTVFPTRAEVKFYRETFNVPFDARLDRVEFGPYKCVRLTWKTSGSKTTEVN